MSAPATDWSPRWDTTFEDEWLGYLIDHRDEWTHPTELFLATDERQRDDLRQKAYEAVVIARNLGFGIAGDRTRGYCFRGYTLAKYVHLPWQLTLVTDEG